MAGFSQDWLTAPEEHEKTRVEGGHCWAGVPQKGLASASAEVSTCCLT